MTNRVLAAALVLQVAVLAFVFWPESVVEAGPIFPDVEQGSIVRAKITGPGGGVIDVQRSNGGCVLPQADDYPCMPDRLRTLFDKLAGLEADNVVTRTASSHLRLRVSPSKFERLVEFDTEDGQTHRLFLGSALTVSASHVRADGRDEVYKVSELTTSDAPVNALGWIETEYLFARQSTLNAVTIDNAKGVMQLVKDGTGRWTLPDIAEGEELDQGRVNSLLTRAASVSLREPLGRQEIEEYGFGSPQGSYTLQSVNDDGTIQTLTLTVGASVEGGYVVKSSESDYYVLVSDFEVEDMLQADRVYVLKPPPTPTPAPTPAETPTPESAPAETPTPSGG
jgi:hypothetical protein